MSSMKGVFCALLVVVGLTGLPLQAGQGTFKLDISRLGPQLRQQVPDFRLPDQQGKVWTRDSIMGPNGAMIVFSRSLDWCPYCKTQVIDLQKRLPELEAQGLGLAVITYDSTGVMADFASRRGITFPLLADPGSQTIKGYGILNTTIAPASSNYGIPFPGTFVVNRQGVVTARFFEEAYQERTTVSSMMLALGADHKPAAATRITTDHLQVTTYASDEVVAPGSLFAIVFEIRPRERMHVYAPGAQGYKVINVTLERNPALVTRPLQYPASEIYFFEPLNERVPVFQRPFRLTQAMALSTAPEHRAALTKAESVTIKGTLDYQACDDKLCFAPKSVPVSYTVKLRQLDTERANVAR